MSFTDAAEKRYQALAKAQPSEVRARAWKEYQRLGLPNASTESWKYTSFNLIGTRVWSEAALAPMLPDVIKSLVEKYESEFDVAVLSSGGLLRNAGGRLKPVMTGTELDIDDGFQALSNAVSNGGYEFAIPANQVSAKPILLIHWHSGAGNWLSTANRVHVGKLAEARVAEIYLGEGNGYLRSDLTQVTLDEGAILTWIRLQEEDQASLHFSEIQFRLGRNAHLQVTGLNAGAMWSRSAAKISIEGEGAQALVNGISFGRNTQHIDQRVTVRHKKGNSESAQLFKSVLNDKARGVLNGKIHIDQDAQKVNSSQLNHNLLLSKQAEADTKPELEIYADDVKANHGASIGRLDEDKLFYLLSRAIPRKEAVHILAAAFVGEVVMKVADAQLREFMESRIARILPLFADSMEAV